MRSATRPCRSRLECTARGAKAVLVLGAVIALSLPVAADTVPSFVLRWGSQGTAPGQFLDPLGIAVDPQGNVYVADWGNHRVQKFSSQGVFLAVWSGSGRQGATGLSPSDVAVDASGTVYVSDVAGDAIIRLDGSLKYLDEWAIQAGPTAIAVDPTGQYLYATWAPLVLQYTTSGTYIRQWFSGSDANNDVNWGIACGPSGSVYVAMNSPHVLKVFTGQGAYLREWGGFGRGDGQLNSPFGVGVSPTECVYVSDALYRVQIFTTLGKFQGAWGSAGSGDNEFRLPVDIAIDSEGAVYVLDSQSVVRKFAGGVVPVAQTTWGQLKLRYR